MSNAEAKHTAGFTLIEVLVALTILAVSLAVLLGVFGTSLQRAGSIRGRTLATSLAQSLLATTAQGTGLRTSDTAGQFADGFRWRVHVAPYGGDRDAEAWPMRPFRVSVEVSWTEGRSERSVTLGTLRLAPKEASR
jgi:general secretion pathway protein I